MTDLPAIDPVYSRVANVLRIGFRIAAALLLIGIVIALIRQEALQTSTDSFRDIPSVLLDFKAAGFIDLAIIAIVITPVAAVFTILRGFMARGDTRFAGYTASVLAILLASITLSLFR